MIELAVKQLKISERTRHPEGATATEGSRFPNGKVICNEKRDPSLHFVPLRMTKYRIVVVSGENDLN